MLTPQSLREHLHEHMSGGPSLRRTSAIALAALTVLTGTADLVTNVMSWGNNAKPVTGATLETSAFRPDEMRDENNPPNPPDFLPHVPTADEMVPPPHPVLPKVQESR